MKKSSVKLATGLLALSSVALSSSALAAEYAIQTSHKELISNNANQGWWNTSGTATAANGNYIVGTISGVEYRNFFTFNLEQVPASDTIVSADLLIYNPPNGATAPGTYNLWDVTTDWATLNTNNGLPPAALFADLAGGVLYSATIFAATPTNGVMQTFPLNAAAIADLNTKKGTFWSVGGQYLSSGNMYGFTSGTFRATLVLKTTGSGGGGNLEQQLCVITDLLLTPQGQRCVDTPTCGYGDWNRGLDSVPDPPTCQK